MHKSNRPTSLNTGERNSSHPLCREALACATVFALIPLFTGCGAASSSTTNVKTTPRSSLELNDRESLKGSCFIAGKVIDGNTGAPVLGAHVVMLSNPTGTVSDRYGQFQLIDIPSGMYTLQVFCVGYLQKEIPNIEAKPDRLINLEVRLEPRASDKNQ